MDWIRIALNHLTSSQVIETTKQLISQLSGVNTTSDLRVRGSSPLERANSNIFHYTLNLPTDSALIHVFSSDFTSIHESILDIDRMSFGQFSRPYRSIFKARHLRNHQFSSTKRVHQGEQRGVHYRDDFKLG